MRNPFDVSRDCVPFYANTIVDVGGSHRRKRFNCQDHARTLECRQGVVLCVADGVSMLRDEHGVPHMSAAEVGAWLAAELSAVAALEALKAGASPDEIRAAVAAELVAGLRPIVASLGTRSHQALATTLLLMVITADWTCAWASGDGFWGVVVPGDDVQQLPGVDVELVRSPGPGFTALSGARHQPTMGRLATTRIHKGAAMVAAELQPVLAVSGRVLGGYVATDGLRDEPHLLQAMGMPDCTSKTELVTLLRRAPDSDDLGLAWAADPLPKLIALAGRAR